ncbi:DUF489 family protein, partial [Gilvimarinus sp. 1_MG-2023]
MTDRRQQAIAIAAVVQAATLVEQLARTGDTSISDATPLLASLFEQNPESFDDIYGDPSHSLQLGINTLQTLASGKGDSLSP